MVGTGVSEEPGEPVYSFEGVQPDFIDRRLTNQLSERVSDDFKKFDTFVAETSPPGIEIVSATPYHPELIPEISAPVARIRTYERIHQPAEVEAWRDRIKEELGFAVAIERVPLLSDWHDRLVTIQNDRGVVTDASAVFELAHNLFGWRQPTVEDSCGDKFQPKSFVDLTACTSFSIDPAGADNIDDTFIVSRSSIDGSIQLRVNIVDGARLFEEGGYLDTYTKMFGETIYGHGTSLPLMGPYLSSGEASFLEGAERFGYTAEMTFDKNGRLFSSNVYPSLSINRMQLSDDQVSDFYRFDDAPSEIAEPLAAIRDLGAALRNNRYPRWRISSSEISAKNVVQELMIATKSAFASYFVRNKIPGVFKTHSITGSTNLIAVYKELRHQGIELSHPRELLDVERLHEIFKVLEGQSQTRVHRRLVDMIRGAARYSGVAGPHDSVGATSYMPIKARFRSGLVNQAQLQKFYAGKTPKSQQSMQRLARSLMATEANHYQRALLFMLYEKLGDTLSRPQRPYLANVAGYASDGSVVAMANTPLRHPIVVTNAHDLKRYRIGEQITPRIYGHSTAGNCFLGTI